MRSRARVLSAATAATLAIGVLGEAVPPNPMPAALLIAARRTPVNPRVRIQLTNAS